MAFSPETIDRSLHVKLGEFTPHWLVLDVTIGDIKLLTKSLFGEEPCGR